MDAIKEFGKKKVPVIAVDEQELRAHVSEVVGQSVEDTLNGLLEAGPMPCARPGVTSVTHSVPVPAPVITSGTYRPKRGQSSPACPKCGICRLKLR